MLTPIPDLYTDFHVDLYTDFYTDSGAWRENTDGFYTPHAAPPEPSGPDLRAHFTLLFAGGACAVGFAACWGAADWPRPGLSAAAVCLLAALSAGLFWLSHRAADRADAAFLEAVRYEPTIQADILGVGGPGPWDGRDGDAD